MTRQDAIDAAPRSRRGYWFTLITGAVLATFFCVFAVLLRHKSVAVAAGSVGIGLVMVTTAVQAAERLFRPERAATRSASLSNQQMLWIKRTRTWFTACFIGGGAVWAVMFCLPGHEAHRVYESLQLFAWTPFMLTQVLADLMGDTVDSAGRKSRGETSLLLQGRSAPVQSRHWGA